MFTIKQVAELLNIGEDLVEKHVKSRRIKAHDLNPSGTYKKIRISQKSIDDFIESCVLEGQSRRRRATKNGPIRDYL